MQTLEGMNTLTRETLIKLVRFAMVIARHSTCEIHEYAAEEVIRGFFANRKAEGVMGALLMRYPGPPPATPPKPKGKRR